MTEEVEAEEESRYNNRTTQGKIAQPCAGADRHFTLRKPKPAARLIDNRITSTRETYEQYVGAVGYVGMPSAEVS